MKTVSKSGLFLARFSILLIGTLLFSCENNLQQVNQFIASPNAPIETGIDEQILYSDSAHLKVKLIAPLLLHFMRDTSYIEFPKGLHAYFYNDSGGVTNELKANYGIRYESVSKMEVEKDVELTNAKGDKLTTQHLTWDEQRKLIYTNDFVKIVTAKETIYGDGLEANQDFSQYTIKKPKGSLKVDQP